MTWRIQPLSLELVVSAFRSVKFLCKSGKLFILELKECPRCQVFFSIQHLSLDNAVNSPDKNIVIVSLKHIFISKFFAQHIQCISRTHK